MVKEWLLYAALKRSGLEDVRVSEEILPERIEEW